MVEAEGFSREADALDLIAPEAPCFPSSGALFRRYATFPQSRGPRRSGLRLTASRPAGRDAPLCGGGSQEGLRVAFGDAPGLRDDQKETLGFPDRDASRPRPPRTAASG
jgi:hypothetical protein